MSGIPPQRCLRLLCLATRTHSTASVQTTATAPFQTRARARKGGRAITVPFRCALKSVFTVRVKSRRLVPRCLVTVGEVARLLCFAARNNQAVNACYPTRASARNGGTVSRMRGEGLCSERVTATRRIRATPAWTATCPSVYKPSSSCSMTAETTSCLPVLPTGARSKRAVQTLHATRQGPGHVSHHTCATWKIGGRAST
jgi:hypothetical protein